MFKVPDIIKLKKKLCELFGQTVNCGGKHRMVLKNVVLMKHPNLLRVGIILLLLYKRKILIIFEHLSYYLRLGASSSYPLISVAL